MAQDVRANYKTFTNGAADAVDTGTLGSQSVKALHIAAAQLAALAGEGEAATVGAAPGVLGGLVEAIPSGITLDALLPLRAQISQGDKLTEAIYSEFERRDEAVVKDAIDSAIRQKRQVIAAFLLTLVLSVFFVVLARRRLKARIEADAAVERQRRAELESISVRFGMATRAARAGVYELHASNESLWWSDSMHELYGRSVGAERLTVAEWLELIHPDDRESARAAIATAISERGELHNRYRVVRPDGSTGHVESLAAVVTDSMDASARLVGIDLDVTARVEAEQREQALEQRLRAASRQAGMAEVATNVLHNVGNVLNSVNVSANLVTASVRKPKAAGLSRVVALLNENQGNLAAFITDDDRGKHLPAYLTQLSNHLATEQSRTLQELESLQMNVAHIKEVVAMQQSYAKRAGVKELMSVTNLVEDSLSISAAEFTRHGIKLLREFEDVPSILVDRHKVLQILVNLLRNAKCACDAVERSDKQVAVRIAKQEGAVQIVVTDNGVGIPPENMTRIFSYGFTTRREGHGFGLHGAALAAKELGGSLYAESDGPAKGATFTLVLPLKHPERVHEQ
ncbi:MAG: sensor histidine kinase [Burkholderiales bacterium]